MEQVQGFGLRSCIGGHGVIPFSVFLSFFLSFCLSFIFHPSSFICQRGRRVAGGELRHLAGSPGGGGDYQGPVIL